MSLPVQEVLQGTFTGRNGSGSITLTGAKVGDHVLILANTAPTSPGDYREFYERTITVADQIQQGDTGDRSGFTFAVTLSRDAATVTVVMEN